MPTSPNIQPLGERKEPQSRTVVEHFPTFGACRVAWNGAGEGCHSPTPDPKKMADHVDVDTLQ